VCPDIHDPDQWDMDHDGVGDFCECAMPMPRCITGGGKKRSDCLLEFNPMGEPTRTKKTHRIRNLFRCTDGDTWCDRDGLKDGWCTFGVALCLDNADPRLPRCTPSSMVSVEVVRPNPASTSPVSQANAQALERGLTGLGLGIERQGTLITPGTTTIGPNVCSPLVHLVAPAPAEPDAKPVRRKIRLRARAYDGRRDPDRLVLECLR
jgi:hypothetical protein